MEQQSLIKYNHFNILFILTLLLITTSCIGIRMDSDINLGDGYYYVRLVSKENNKVSYETLSIRFSKIDNEVRKLREDGKIKEKIEVVVEQSDEETSSQSPDVDKNTNKWWCARLL